MDKARCLAAAERFLERKGYTIEARSWTCDAGEMDLVVRDPDETLAFVAVLFRDADEPGFGDGIISAMPRAKFEEIALAYMTQEASDEECTIRFDDIVMHVLGHGGDRVILRHHLNCYGCSE